MTDLNIPTHISENWQKMANALAALTNVPAALVMRLTEDDIEVFIASQSQGNPYEPGAKETLVGSGLYCETVIQTLQELLVPNALTDEAWDHNPDIKLNMIAYLGLPIMLPNGKPFGTICVLDTKENAYSETQRNLLEHLRDLLQSQLALLYMNQELDEENRSLSYYVAEIKMLRGIIPICSYCKSVRNDDGDYESVEAYLHSHAGADFSHTICPTCMAKHHPGVHATHPDQ